MQILNRKAKHPNVGLEDQNGLNLLGNISRAKTYSELLLSNRCRSNIDFSKWPPDNTRMFSGVEIIELSLDLC